MRGLVRILMKINSLDKKTTTTSVTTLEVEYGDLVELLKEQLPLMRGKDVTSIELYVRILGGRDWSNTLLDLREHSVVVKVTSERNE